MFCILQITLWVFSRFYSSTYGVGDSKYSELAKPFAPIGPLLDNLNDLSFFNSVTIPKACFVFLSVKFT